VGGSSFGDLHQIHGWASRVFVLLILLIRCWFIMDYGFVDSTTSVSMSR
jgi:hypothetical protein